MLKVMKAIDKIDARIDNPLEYYESRVKQTQQNIYELREQIRIEEGTYSAVAKDKVERKLKIGSEKTVRGFQSNINKNQANLERETQHLNEKISSYETDMKDEILLEKRKLEKADLKRQAEIAAINAIYEIKQDDCEKQIRAIQKTYEKKIKTQEEKITNISKECENNITYFNEQLENCYEPIPIVVQYPPSHFKKIQELAEIEKAIEADKAMIQMMKNAELEALKSQKEMPKLDHPYLPGDLTKEQLEEEIKLKQLRDQAKSEGRAGELSHKSWKEAILPLDCPPAPVIKKPIKKVQTAEERFLDSLSHSNRNDYEQMSPEQQQEYLKTHMRTIQSVVGPGIQTYPKPIIED